MHNRVNDLESPVWDGSGNRNGNGDDKGDNCFPPADIPRGGATTPAERRLSRPFNALMVPHKTIKKICCIGAGYVGK